MVRQLAFTALFIVGKSMLRVICIVFSIFMVSCQGIRNPAIYNLELVYIEESIRRQNDIVEHYLKSSCCEQGKISVSTHCQSILDTYKTVKDRSSYHLDMMRYLGRLTDKRPFHTKLVIEGDKLCE